MGTNFYLHTTDKKTCEKWFLYGEYSLTDRPMFGYEIHIAKTSCGWKPLFEAHDNMKSVRALKNIFNSGGFRIFDEYGEEYTLEEFQKRVIDWNKDNPEAISHPEYENGRWRRDFFIDDDGYEFMKTEFC